MGTKRVSVVERIKERLLGKTYYIAVVAQKGTGTYFVNSTIYRSERAVKAYREHVKTLPTVEFVGYYPFRSRDDFRLSVAEGRRVDEEEARKLAGKGRGH